MKLSKLILLTILTFLFITQAHASRTKKNLLSNQEAEIVSLLKEKISIVDKLIKEARIYKNESDPLVQKDFYNAHTGFVTKYSKRDGQFISTDTDTSSLIKKEKPKGLRSSNKIGVPNMFNTKKGRDIFNINMRISGSLNRESFYNQINYLFTLSYAYRNTRTHGKNFTKSDLLDVVEKNISPNIQPLATELLEKYIKLMYHLSQNPVREYFIQTQRTDSLSKVLKTAPIRKWSIYAEALKFKFALDKSNPHYNKKNYDLSKVFNEYFDTVASKQNMYLTTLPSYFDKRELSKEIKCIETAKDIKYKGRICINKINVDKDIYFDYGIFETRESNFLQQNKAYIESLNEIHKKLATASNNYIKYFVMELNSPTPSSTDTINLEGGI